MKSDDKKPPAKKINLHRIFDELLNQTKDVFWVRNIDYSKQLYINPAYEKIWGLSQNSLYKHPEKWINTLYPVDRERLEKNIAKRNPTVLPGQKFYENYRIKQPDGSLRWIEDESFPIFDKNGEHLGFAGIAKDITEKKNYEAFLKKAKDNAESANKAKSEFIANMSHDIKTPLSGIVGLAEILSLRLEGEEAEFAQYMMAAGRQLLDFFDNCLELAKSEGSELIIPQERFHLKNLINEISELFLPAISSKQLDLQVEYATNLPNYFYGSRSGLYRVLLNLISNAVKFTEQGHIRISINLSKKSTSKQAIVVFNVSDTGIGIPKDKQKIIFERFTRLTPSDQGIFTGSGIGLHVVMRFVKAMGGEINVTSRELSGSRFSVAIPMEIPLLDESEYEEELSSGESLPNKLPESGLQSLALKSPLGILAIEDNPLALEVIQSIFKTLNCQVSTAATGQAALSKFPTEKFQLVILDIGLPDISGHKVAKQIREIEQSNGGHVPIIALTAHVTEALSRDCQAAGIDAVLAKPLSMNMARELLEIYAQPHNPTPAGFSAVEEKTDQVEELPIIDDSADPALLKILFNSLPEAIEDLDKAKTSKNLQQLCDAVHKLHGALCYSKTPQLLNAAEELESAIKSRTMGLIDLLLAKLISAIKSFQEVYQRDHQL